MNVQMLWGIIPPDLTPSLSRIAREGLGDVSRMEVIAIAAALDAQLPENFKRDALTPCWMLEAAAKQWLERRGAK